MDPALARAFGSAGRGEPLQPEPLPGARPL